MSIPPLPAEPLVWKNKPSEETPFDAEVLNPWGASVMAHAGAARIYAETALHAAQDAAAPTDQMVANALASAESLSAAAVRAIVADAIALRPSGDTTGATDTARINTALTQGDVNIRGGRFHLNGSVAIPSGRTLILEDAELYLVDGSNVPVVRNANIVRRTDPTADHDIGLIGIGQAYINGNPTGQTNQGDTVNYWLNQGVVFCGVTRLRVQGLRISANKGAMQLIGCAHVRGGDLDFDQDGGTVNQDGLDIGPDSFDIRLSGITGRCQDDPFSFFAKGTAWMIPPNTYRLTEGGTGGDVRDVHISDVNVTAVNENCIRLQAADGSTMERVKFTGVVSGGSGNLVHLGPTSYSTTPPTDIQFRDVSIENIVHGGTLLRIGSPCRGVAVRNAQLRTGATTRRVLLFLSSFATDVRDVTLSNIQAMTDAAGVGSWTVYETHASAVANTITVSDVYVERGTITANAGSTSGLRLNDVTVRTATGPVFGSVAPEANGSATNVKVQALAAGVTHRYDYVCALQLDACPSFQGSDVLPAAVPGSKPFIRWRALADESPMNWTSTTTAHANSGFGTVNIDVVRSTSPGTGDITIGVLPAPLRPSQDTYGMWVNQQTGASGLVVAYTNGGLRLIGTSANPGHRLRGSLTYPLP